VGASLKPNDIIVKVDGADARNFEAIFAKGDHSICPLHVTYAFRLVLLIISPIQAHPTNFQLYRRARCSTRQFTSMWSRALPTRNEASLARQVRTRISSSSRVSVEPRVQAAAAPPISPLCSPILQPSIPRLPLSPHLRAAAAAVYVAPPRAWPAARGADAHPWRQSRSLRSSLFSLRSSLFSLRSSLLSLRSSLLSLRSSLLSLRSSSSAYAPPSSSCSLPLTRWLAGASRCSFHEILLCGSERYRDVGAAVGCRSYAAAVFSATAAAAAATTTEAAASSASITNWPSCKWRRPKCPSASTTAASATPAAPAAPSSTAGQSL